LLLQDKIRYSCNRGYRIQGAAELVCQGNKQYDRPPPVCEIMSCGMPPELPNAIINGNNREWAVYGLRFVIGDYNFNIFLATGVTYGQTARYTCIEGYESNNETVSCEENGHWSISSLKCQRVNCGTPPPLEFGFVGNFS